MKRAKPGRPDGKPGVTADTPVSAPDSSEAIDPDHIAVAAYFLWQSGGCAPDSADDDWFRAEQELSERRNENRNGKR